MYDLFAHSPVWLVFASFTIVPAIAAVVLHAIFRRIVPPEKLLPHHEVAGFLVAVVGVLYAVVLGFLVISVWASFDEAQRNANAETNDVADLIHLAHFLPEPQRMRARVMLSQYTFEVRDNEWEQLGNGEEDHRARVLMLAAFRIFADAPLPASGSQAELLREASLRDAAMVSFRELASHRRLRLLDAQSHVPEPMYLALILGSLILLAFVFLFGVSNAPLQLVMTGLIAAMIGLQLGLIFELDRPFWGALKVSSNAWTLLIDDNHLQNLYPNIQLPE